MHALHVLTFKVRQRLGVSLELAVEELAFQKTCEFFQKDWPQVTGRIKTENLFFYHVLFSVEPKLCLCGCQSIIKG